MMRILQLIDSLEAGGAERMAVNYANSLSRKIDFSGLIATRKEGALLPHLDSGVSYLCLHRKGVFDRHALFNLRKFVVKNEVQYIHAHSSSFFLAVLLKISYPKINIVWHDHYGDSEFLKNRPAAVLKLLSLLFYKVITVNRQLEAWVRQELFCKDVIFLSNFSIPETVVVRETFLKGISGKRIVSLANLRPQKNHFLLLEVARKMQKTFPEWTFHLVGKDFSDTYSKKIRSCITQWNLSETVFIYGSRNDIRNIIDQTTIGVLTSHSEGLPVSLLEMGGYEKPVIMTNVGQISAIIQDGENGFLVESGDVSSFYKALVRMIENENLALSMAQKLKMTMDTNYSDEVVLKRYLDWITIRKI